MAKRPGRKRKQKKPTLASISMISVDNPMYSRDHAESASNPKKIEAAFNMRESYVGFLWQRKHIDDAQKMAADRLRQAYEKMGGSGARAMDYSKLRVDGGGAPHDLHDGHLRAANYIRQSFNTLGPDAHILVMRFCAEGAWPSDTRQSKKEPGPLPELSRHLTTLAELWGWKTAVDVVRKVG